MKGAIFAIAPWGQEDTRGKTVGLTVDMLDAIGKRSGITFQHQLVPFKRMLSMMGTGALDISIIYRNALTESISDPLILIYEDDAAVFGLKGTDLRIYDDLHKVSIALPRGVNYLPRFDKDGALEKIFTTGHKQSVKMLIHDRVKAVAGSRRALLYNLQNVGLSPIELGQAYNLSSKQVWLQVSKQTTDPEIRAALIDAVKELREEGVFEKILDDFFEPGT